MNTRIGVTAGAAVAAAAAIAGAAILIPSAQAGQDQPPEPRALSQPDAAQLGTELADGLGESAAGWYFDGDSGRLVMNVTDEDAAREAREQGAEPRIVQNSMASLRAATGTLRQQARIPGTAWSIDPRTNKVVVVADSTVTGDTWNSLTAVTDRMGDSVTVKRSEGEFKPFADGGDAIFGGGSRCSLGFNVTVNGAKAFLTAGHCGQVGQRWTADQAGNAPLGTTVVSQFPGADFALVGYDDQNADAPSTVDLKNGDVQAINRVEEASVGMPVQRSGSTTGLSQGTVTGLNATVNYGNGDIVDGLIQTDVCAEPGDSGGSMFSGDAAVGLTSGGSGDCTNGGVTFFQPVSTALAAVDGRIGDGS
ncbi:S1 family peptidase [Streptomyces sp. 549]|uniref:S1 family peptidase n=1 Tax=Streptomyces sp. 549 TaxID=3049076 RepID=UPI0024C3CFFC|nr:S1 family peptidase [Streptomyces sp. 549]MDK1474667.1 S1 family peptidase [Streptomyces sp. 549]